MVELYDEIVEATRDPESEVDGWGSIDDNAGRFWFNTETKRMFYHTGGTWSTFNTAHGSVINRDSISFNDLLPVVDDITIDGMRETVKTALTRLDNFVNIHFSDNDSEPTTTTTTIINQPTISWINIGFVSDVTNGSIFSNFVDWGTTHLLEEIINNYNNLLNVSSYGDVTFNPLTGIITLVGTYKIDLSIQCNTHPDIYSVNKLKITLDDVTSENIVKANGRQGYSELNLSLHQVVVCGTGKSLKIRISTEPNRSIKINSISMSIYKII